MADRPQQVKTQQGLVAGQGFRPLVCAERHYAALPFDAPARGFVASHHPTKNYFSPRLSCMKVYS